MNTRRLITLCSLALIGVLCFDDDTENSSSYAGGAQGNPADWSQMNSDGSGGDEEIDLATMLAWLDDESWGDDSGGSDDWGWEDDSSGWVDDNSGWSNDQAASYDGGGWTDSSMPSTYYDQNEYANPESSMYDPYEVDSEGHVGGAYENPDSGYYSPSYDSSYDSGGYSSFDSSGGYDGY